MSQKGIIMKTTRSLFVYDHINKTIVASKVSLKKAGRPNTAESDLLASMMREHPDYKVVEKEISEKDHETLIQDFIDQMGEAV